MTFNESFQVISCPMLSSNEEGPVSFGISQSLDDTSTGSSTQLKWLAIPVISLSLLLISNPTIEIPTSFDDREFHTNVTEIFQIKASSFDWTEEEFLDTYSRLQHFEEDWSALGMELYDEM